LLSLLPASSTVIGLIVLRQVPTARDLAGVLLVGLGVALHQTRETASSRSAPERLIGDALASSEAFRTVAHLADQIGPRPSGSQNAALAVAWTTERFRSWGIDVRNEPVIVPHWVRGAESATLVSHNHQRLVVTACGGSVATPREGIAAEVVELHSFEQLDGRIQGKIVLFHNPMDMDLVRADRVLEAYRKAAVFRSNGASRAAAHGAVAVLLHSVGSASLRTPHTGSVIYDDHQRTIPAAALTAEDAWLIHRLLERGEHARVHLTLQSEMLPEVDSANVIAEIHGRAPAEEIVVIGAHLDSWDLGTGAVDNASGVSMVMEAMRLIHEAKLVPRRTIRCVLFMNEEMGMSGGRAYFAAHRGERHVAAIESDMGVGAPRGFCTTLRGDALDSLRMRLAPLAGVGADHLEPREATGVDTSLLVKSGVPGFGFLPDDRHYFDVHHSPADTLDKVDPRELARCSAAVTALTWILADQ
jgi:carboxypeptidase Q